MLMGCSRNDAVGRRELVPPLRDRNCGVGRDRRPDQTEGEKCTRSQLRAKPSCKLFVDDGAM